MLFQKPMRELMQHQIDGDVMPIDALVDQSAFRDGHLHLNGETFSCLVVPYAERLPMAALQRIAEGLNAGLATFFVDGLPSAASQAVDATDVLAAISGHPRCQVVPLAGLAAALRAEGHGEIQASRAEPYLRHYHYRTVDGQEVLMLFNEDPHQPIRTTLATGIAGPVHRYDAFANVLLPTPFSLKEGGTLISVELAPGEAQVLVFGGGHVAPPGFRGTVIQTLAGPWEVSLATAAEHPRFTPWRQLEALVNLHSPDRLPDFTGTIRYQTTFTAPTGAGPASLDLGAVYEIAEVTVNGTTLPARIAPPYVFDLTGLIRPGHNHLTIDVTNTLVNQVQDWLSQFHQLEPTGLLGPVGISLTP